MEQSKLTVWALFDSGGGSYSTTIANTSLNQVMEVFPLGLDMEGKNSNFIPVDLGSLGELFDGWGNGDLMNTLNSLPKPDIILASPPCESWSNASAYRGGNNCWYKVDGEDGNKFTIRPKQHCNEWNELGYNYVKDHRKSVMNRLNGEACAYNLIRIIETFNPKVWVIENPQSSRLWSYYEDICEFKGYRNVAHYSTYNDTFTKKPTTFYSNVELVLQKSKGKAKIVMGTSRDGRPVYSRNYNDRSRIPQELVEDILKQLIEIIEK